MSQREIFKEIKKKKYFELSETENITSKILRHS